MTILHNPGLPRVLNRITPQRLELTLMLIKERKKKLRYLGSYLQHYNDRTFLYNAMGGLKGTKFILERHHHRAQFCHPTLHSERYDVRTVKLKGSQFDQLGNFTRNTWDCSIATTNLFQDATFRRHLTSVHKDEAIALLEGWGVKYVLLDEIRKPRVQDSIYVRHHLYAHKFPYIPDPVTNAYYGDADWKWKGDQKIDYKEHGAETKDDRNTFRSLWSFAPKAVSSASGVETKRLASPERATTPKNLKKEK
ncbi:hypothetical protein C3747_10g568 [Trypanosoma cruzi]|uniref:Uncharacterized protein n=2 Tax=Trypanosoma cruzi TaxID=5693 RepID=Q4D7E9_TRYCC|nr:hypothetical protein, conserved [Trypanosoma cruzi]EAN88452.1 hypothetical protein, conserved [Trypanosoma cruzi]PWV19272.1 hypothetical protein C3747_10g568 [Trypanosoma cruzi]RNC55168.1 hypothetical protein TcCL_ESM07350 [Trypanosoma cruzi]|eukprot:XP_810303.1 hypothetical protein [Trypanosoma cruzi strain CL Brener]